jgi:hypothetical protein
MGGKFIGIAEQAVEYFIILQRITIVISIVDRIVFIVGEIIIQFKYRVLADGLGIRKCRADVRGMKRIIIILIEELRHIKPVIIIICIIIPISFIIVNGPVQIDGKSPVLFNELMPEGQVGAIYIETFIYAGTISLRSADRSIILIYSG